jgi:hypothetical protein
LARADERGTGRESRAHLLGPVPEGGVVEDDVEVVARDGVGVGGRARGVRDARATRRAGRSGEKRKGGIGAERARVRATTSDGRARDSREGRKSERHDDDASVRRTSARDADGARG